VGASGVWHCPSRPVRLAQALGSELYAVTISEPSTGYEDGSHFGLVPLGSTDLSN
jgi:hypothetical protein